MQPARTLIGAKVPGTCSTMKNNIAPVQRIRRMTSINHSAVSESLHLACSFCACQPRLGPVYVASTARWRLASRPGEIGTST